MSTLGSDAKPGDVVYHLKHRDYGVVVECPHNDPKRQSLMELWAVWKMHDRWIDAIWCYHSEVRRVADEASADALLADFTKWRLTNA